MNKEACKRPRPILKQRKLSGEKLSQYVRQLFEKRGREAFELARKAVLQEAEKLECKTVRDALHYLANYWTDTTRPALLSIACKAAGGDPDATEPIAVPLVLICEAVDIHDDIIDQSVTKGNHLTLYGKFGKEIALLIGDALLFKGLAMLHEAEGKISHKKMKAILRITNELFFELGDAEALELSLKNQGTNLKIEDYLAMVRKKAADVEAYLRISAILANAPREQIEALAQYGRVLGMLIILGDDNSDMFNPLEIINRVRNEALPLPILYALQDQALREKVIQILTKKRIDKKDTEELFELTHQTGGFSNTASQLRALMQKGKENLLVIKNCPELERILESTYPE